MPNYTGLNVTIRVVESITLVREINVSVAGENEEDALDRAWRKAENGDFDSELYYEKPVITDVDREYVVS